ncbi:LPS export ABC transporter periplasmic protein LptC [Flavihumibacter petaseus]|uniref:LPS export ABC transporter periplasmic protein LptC n=1 Tax=Flavihumibacter petaseus NBRC 106054 TaxID=1220578 RepID=A0A0E9MWV6_9BACT|nr:LPS export ABC transporter periplasmic protein LptC [Flavihumibacter petaseus]GAO42069.1 hypothetical protein FPE01S_01_10820 [Flavihumibacter petaseus NBRC 106054]
MTNGYRYIFLLLLVLAAGCENTYEEIRELTGKKVAVEEAKQVESYLSQGGKMKARLTAPVMNRYQTDSPYLEFPKSLHVDFYNDSLVIESQLNAKYGRYRENERRVFLRDSVMVFNLKKDTLKCKELWWDQNSEKFYTDKPVQIHQPDKIIFGEGLEADQSFNWYVLDKINGTVLVPKGGFPVESTPIDSTKRDSLSHAREAAAGTAAEIKPGATPPPRADTPRRRGFTPPTLLPDGKRPPLRPLNRPAPRPVPTHVEE